MSQDTHPPRSGFDKYGHIMRNLVFTCRDLAEISLDSDDRNAALDTRSHLQLALAHVSCRCAITSIMVSPVGGFYVAGVALATAWSPFGRFSDRFFFQLGTRFSVVRIVGAAIYYSTLQLYSFQSPEELGVWSIEANIDGRVWQPLDPRQNRDTIFITMRCKLMSRICVVVCGEML